VMLAVQINGKIRDQVEVPVDAGEEAVREAVFALEKVRAYTDGKILRKFIVVPGRLVSIVVQG
jgi:leucyl-tRNA synthetase